MPGLVVVGLDTKIPIDPAASNIHWQLYEPLHHWRMEFLACVCSHWCMSVATGLDFQLPPNTFGHFRCAGSLSSSCVFGACRRAQRTMCDLQTAVRRVDERVHR